MSDTRLAELVSVFSTGSTTLYCSLKAQKEFPHWTEGCPDPTTTTTTTTPAPTTSTTTPAPTTSTTTPAPTTARPAVEVLADDEVEPLGPRRLLKRGGHHGGHGKARTQFTVAAGRIYGFKNKGGCRDDSSFTCFDDLLADDCAYTAITTVTDATDGNTVTLTFTSTTDSDGVAETIALVCPFSGKAKGDDCDAPTEESIRCERQPYSYGGDDNREFSLECSTVEDVWDGDYPACPSALQ